MSDEEFFDCQEDNPSNINILGTNVIKRKYYSNYYIEDFEKIKKFIINIEEYNYNSPTNEEHIKTIENVIRKTHKLYGIITTITNKHNHLILIDGHHRILALKNLIRNGYQLKISLDIHNYNCDQFTDDCVMKLFESLNNTKPFRTNIDFVKSSEYIITKIKKNIPKLFSESKTRANFPRLHLKSFNNSLQKYLEKNKEYNEEIIILKLLGLNKRFKKMKFKEFIKQ